jgi:hypothetical protein
MIRQRAVTNTVNPPGQIVFTKEEKAEVSSPVLVPVTNLEKALVHSINEYIDGLQRNDDDYNWVK